MPVPGTYIAGNPCFEFGVAGNSSITHLLLQVDTFGDYEVLLLPNVAKNVSHRELIGYSAIRLLDGRHIFPIWGEVDLMIPGINGPTTCDLGIFRVFNVAGHAPRIHGFIGSQFLENFNVELGYRSIVANLT